MIWPICQAMSSWYWMIITLFTIARFIHCLSFWLSIYLPNCTWCSCVDPIHHCRLQDGLPRDACTNYVGLICALHQKKRGSFSHPCLEARQHKKQQRHFMNGRRVGLRYCAWQHYLGVVLLTMHHFWNIS